MTEYEKFFYNKPIRFNEKFYLFHPNNIYEISDGGVYKNGGTWKIVNENDKDILITHPEILNEPLIFVKGFVPESIISNSIIIN